MYISEQITVILTYVYNHMYIHIEIIVILPTHTQIDIMSQKNMHTHNVLSSVINSLYCVSIVRVDRDTIKKSITYAQQNLMVAVAITTITHITMC